MKVAVIGPVYPYRGGIAHHTTMLDYALQEHGHSTLIVTFQRQYPVWLYPGDTDKDPSRKPLQTQAEYILDPVYPWTWSLANKRIKLFNPDLVVIQWWTTFWAIPYATIRKFLQSQELYVGYLIHNVIPHENHIWDKWLTRYALRKSNFFITLSQQEKKRLVGLLPTARVKVCPLPIYKNLSNENISKSDARRILDLPDFSPVLLFFGIIRPYKGLRVLIQALALLREFGKEPILIIAGEFWESKNSYLQQIEKYQLSEQVRVEDRYIPNEQVELYFSAADLMVAPYVGGTQSAVVGIALGYGIPIIVTEIIAASISDEYKKNNMQIIPAGNAEALAIAINKYLEQPEIFYAEHITTQDGWWRLVQTIEEISDQA